MSNADPKRARDVALMDITKVPRPKEVHLEFKGVMKTVLEPEGAQQQEVRQKVLMAIQTRLDHAGSKLRSLEFLKLMQRGWLKVTSERNAVIHQREFNRSFEAYLVYADGPDGEGPQRWKNACQSMTAFVYMKQGPSEAT